MLVAIGQARPVPSQSPETMCPPLEDPDPNYKLMMLCLAAEELEKGSADDFHKDSRMELEPPLIMVYKGNVTLSKPLGIENQPDKISIEGMWQDSLGMRGPFTLHGTWRPGRAIKMLGTYTLGDQIFCDAFTMKLPKTLEHSATMEVCGGDVKGRIDEGTCCLERRLH